MGFIFYGEYARIGVYQMQQLVKMSNVNEEYLVNKMINTKMILASLAEISRFSQNKKFYLITSRAKITT
jgi:hypothetical protein